MEAANDNTQYLTAEEVSQRYRGEIAVRTLANWRCLGVGPRFVKVGGRNPLPIVRCDRVGALPHRHQHIELHAHGMTRWAPSGACHTGR